MALLDLFRPAWKHSRAAVRREAVAALGAEDIAVLSEVLRRDPDASVRRTALKKIDDAELLAELAAKDTDDEVRSRATEKLDDLRLRAALDATDETAARKAVAALKTPRTLVDVACRAGAPVARQAAVAAIQEGAALAEVVRAASDADVRRAALERIGEPRLLKDLALHDAPRALQLRAVERLDDIESLEVVAQRATVKAVRSAAAERLRALRPEPPRSARRPDPAKAEQDRVAKMVADAEQARAREAERAREERRAAETAAAAQAAERAAAAQAAERARAEDPVLKARRAEEEARRAEEKARREAERVRREEEKARREAERARRESERAEEEARFVAAVEPLLARLETLAASEDRKGLEDVLKGAREVPSLRGRAGEKAEEVRGRFDDLRGRAAARLSELRDAESWRRWANVPKFEALIARAEALLTAETTDARQIATDLKGLMGEWKALGAPPRERADGLWAKFKEAADKIHARAQEGFAVLDEERAANLEKKRELCARAEAVAESTDWKATADLLKQLQEEWKAIGPVPKDEADAIWTRFRTACDKFFERRKPVLAELENERVANLAELVRLCEQAEALKSSTDWRGTAERLKALQAAWKAVGPAGRTRAEADEVWTRFRAACDHYFERRKAAFAAEDEKRQANLPKKEALVARAESLADGAEVADPDATIRELMSEWKAIGHVPREQADALWSRLRIACDKIRSPEPVSTEAAAAEASRFQNRPLEGLAELAGKAGD